MYINDFNMALMAFDEMLDRIARARRAYGCNCKRQAEPEVIEATYKELPSKKCECKKSDTIRLDDILDDVKHIIYNDPATIVTFSDGSKVCVKACEKDSFSKEAGLMYAIVKRLYANSIDKNGYVRTKGLGEKINKLIEKATDQKEVERKRRAKRKAKEAKANLANEVSEKAAKEACDQIYKQD